MIPQYQANSQSASYSLPNRLIIPLVRDLLACRSRSFAADSQAAMAAVPAPEITGSEFIPARGPCLVACNHYTRPGFGAWWLTFAISAAIAARRATGADPDIRWIMTGAWTFPGSHWKRRILTPLTRWGFLRVAAIYGFVTMPPMPPDPGEVASRAEAVRRALLLARRCATSGGMIGLAPEGRDVDGGLGEPPPGVGRFFVHLTAPGLPVLPVGVRESGGRLNVSFGPTFYPIVPQTRSERDRCVASQVMEAIGRLLI